MEIYFEKKHCPECGSPVDRFMKIETVAEMFDLSCHAVRGLIKRREITFHKMGTRVRISYDEMKRYFIRYPAKADVYIEQEELD